MKTINAQTIIDELTAAAQAIKHAAEEAGFTYQPETITPAQIRADQEHCATHAIKSNSIPWGFEIEHQQETEYVDESLRACHSMAYQQPAHIVDAHHWMVAQSVQEARGELLQDVPDLIGPEKLTFQVSEKGKVTLRNCAKNLLSYAAAVRSNAAAFGGGMVKAPRKARAFKPWPAASVRLVAEMLEEKNHSDAASLADAKCGALYYIGEESRGRDGKISTAYFLYAPQPVDGIDDRFMSARRQDGQYCVFHVDSGQTVGYLRKSRRAAEDSARDKFADVTPEQLEAAIGRAKPCDQQAARALWMQEHGIEAQPEEIHDAPEHDDHACEDSATAYDPAAAEFIEQAVACAALAGEMRAEDDQAEQAPELAECCAAGDEMADMMASSTPGTTASAASTDSTTGSAPGSARAVGGTTGTGETGQRISGRSGAWSARFYTTRDGRPVANFYRTGSDMVIHASFDSGSDRMRWLQQHARQADEAARQRADEAARAAMASEADRVHAQPDMIEPDQHKPKAPDHSKADPWDGIHWGCYYDALQVSGEQVRAMHPAAFNDIYDSQEAVNYHTEALMMQCQRAGRDDLAQVLAHLARLQRSSDYMGIDADQAAAREVVACDLRGEDPGRIEPDVAKWLHAWGYALTTGPDGGVSGAGAVDPVGELAVVSSGQFKNKNGDAIEGGDFLKISTGAGGSDPVSAGDGMLTITLERAEGPCDECGQPVTVASFAEADAVLLAWSETAPKSGGYNKCDFLVTWPDGSTYDGRYDLKHHSIERPSLADDMASEAEFWTGERCPAHMDSSDYERFLSQHSSDAKRSECLDTLARLAQHAGYFKRAQPVAIDLRALVSEGMHPADFIGLGVRYTGDICNQGSNGAIVEAEPCQWRGVQVVVITEDGKEHHLGASDFDDERGGRYRLDYKRHGAPYLAQLAAAHALRLASSSAAKAQAEAAHAAELARLAVEYPQLKRADSDYSGGKLAAQNMRILLKETFPGQKFSVTSDYNSVNVRWQDGPTDAEVQSVIGPFDIGASDSQTDYFYTVKTAWSKLFGGCQYLFTHRHESPELIARALEQCYPDASQRPSVEDWQNNRGVFDWCGDDSARHWMQQTLNEISCYQAPAPKRSARSKA